MTLAERIARRLKALGWDEATASKQAGFAPTFLRDLFEGRKSSIRGSSAVRLARALGTSVEWLLEERGAETARDYGVASDRTDQFEADLSPLPPRRSAASIMVPEFEAAASAGGGANNDDEQLRALWPFSRQNLDAMRLTHADLAIIEIVGDSMAPTLASGDRVLIDRADKRLPGVFVIWDGDGLIAKRVERVPGRAGSPARLRITSDNKLHNDHEVEAEWVRIVGRVVGLIRRL